MGVVCDAKVLPGRGLGHSVGAVVGAFGLSDSVGCLVGTDGEEL